VQNKRVSVRVGEERHLAHTGVVRLSGKLDTVPLERRACGCDVGHAQGDAVPIGAELDPDLIWMEEENRDVAGLEFGKDRVRPRIRAQAERLAVEPLCPFEVACRQRDEVRTLDLDQPTEPSIWSWISRFISTAYSSGSSFVIGSTKPETIIADASASESPRDIR
jgi:hypothetical protein